MTNLFINIPFISIMLAIFAAVACFLVPDKWARTITLIVTFVIGALSGYLLYVLSNSGEAFVFTMGHFPAPWGNELKAGSLEALLSLVFSIVTFLSIYCTSLSLSSDIPKNRRLYYLMINLLLSSLLALTYTNDLFTAYVFVEINTISACAIVSAKDSGKTIIATIKYLIMSLLGSGMILISISIIYSITGHLLMKNIYVTIQNLYESNQYIFPIVASMFLMVIGLGIKSAMFPFHTWLPDAHGYATSASSSVLSGIVLKGYIVLLLKVIFRVFGTEIFGNTNLPDLIFILGILGMIIASMKALKEQNIKRMLAYSSIAQVGYIFMGIGFNTTVAYIAAIYHILSHAITKPMLFLAANSFIKKSDDKKKFLDLTGAAFRAQFSGLAFLVGSFSMIGVPLFAGFVSKYYLASAALQSPSKLIWGLLALGISTVLNAMYFIPFLLTIFTKVKPKSLLESLKSIYFSRAIIAMIIFMALNLLLGIMYSPILSIIKQGLEVFGC